MTKKEQVIRNLGLTFDFVNELIDKPELIEQLPDSSEIVFVEKDFTSVQPLNEKASKPVKHVSVRNRLDLAS